jgi:hypothetical protein
MGSPSASQWYFKGLGNCASVAKKRKLHPYGLLRPSLGISDGDTIAWASNFIRVKKEMVANCGEVAKSASA